jgi:hypothetical protein
MIMNEINGLSANLSSSLAGLTPTNLNPANGSASLNQVSQLPLLSTAGEASPCGCGIMASIGRILSQLAQVVQSVVGLLSNLLGGGQSLNGLNQNNIIPYQTGLEGLTSDKASSKLGFLDSFSKIVSNLMTGGIGSLVDGVGSLFGSGGGIGSIVKKAGSFIKKIF